MMRFFPRSSETKSQRSAMRPTHLAQTWHLACVNNANSTANNCLNAPSKYYGVDYGLAIESIYLIVSHILSAWKSQTLT